MPLMYNANTPEGTLPSIENISIASLGDANARMNAHPDVASVRRKIASVAAYYDPQRQGGLKGFNGAELDPTALKEQLRRNFGIQVTPAELGALVTLFDKDGDGTVDCRCVGGAAPALPRHTIKCRRNGFDQHHHHRSGADDDSAGTAHRYDSDESCTLSVPPNAPAPATSTPPPVPPFPPPHHPTPTASPQRVPARVFQDRQDRARQDQGRARPAEDGEA